MTRVSLAALAVAAATTRLARLRTTLLAALAATLLCLAAAPAAHGWTTIVGIPDTETRVLYDRWQAESHLRTPDVTVIVENRDCTEAQSIACINDHTRPFRLVMASPVWLWHESDSASSERQADQRNAHMTFLHELGHIRDLRPRGPRFSYAYRRAFVRIMGYDRGYATRAGWKSLLPGFVPIREAFAMAYAWCALDPRTPQTDPAMAGYEYHPTLEQHRKVCALLARPWR